MTTLDREQVEDWVSDGEPLRRYRSALEKLVGALRDSARDRALLSVDAGRALTEAEELLEGRRIPSKVCARCHESVPEWFLEEFDIDGVDFAPYLPPQGHMERFCRACTESMPYPLLNETEDAFVERWLPIKARWDAYNEGKLARGRGDARDANPQADLDLRAAWWDGWDWTEQTLAEKPAEPEPA